MIYIIDHTTLPKELTNGKIYNLSSPLEGFERINIIPHDLMLTEENQYQFDMLYAQAIIQYGMVEMMKIILPVYNGEDVYLIVYHDNGYFDAITESVVKFIQNRYGIIPVYINDMIDYDFTPTQYNMSLSVNGLFNFDQDKEIYVKEYVREMYNMGQPIEDGKLY